MRSIVVLPSSALNEFAKNVISKVAKNSTCSNRVNKIDILAIVKDFFVIDLQKVAIYGRKRCAVYKFTKKIRIWEIYLPKIAFVGVKYIHGYIFWGKITYFCL